MDGIAPERMVQCDGTTSVTPQPISTAALTPLAARTEKSCTVISLPAESRTTGASAPAVATSEAIRLLER